MITYLLTFLDEDMVLRQWKTRAESAAEAQDNWEVWADGFDQCLELVDCSPYLPSQECEE